MKAFLPLKAKALDPDEEAAWFAGRVPRRLLAIPFGGPIPSPKSALGVDLDGEFFSERTDIYGDVKYLRENRERLVDWHHSAHPPSPKHGDPTGMMTGAIIGKSILDPDPDEDGWWVDLWLKLGDKRVALIQRLAQRGAQLFGSSQPLKAKVDRDTGEIVMWAHMLQTLSTSPQNTYSVLRPAKAMLEEADEAGLEVPRQMATLLEEMRDLDADLRRTSLAGDDGAKAGRVLTPDELEALTEYATRTERLASFVEGLRAE